MRRQGWKGRKVSPYEGNGGRLSILGASCWMVPSRSSFCAKSFSNRSRQLSQTPPRRSPSSKAPPFSRNLPHQQHFRTVIGPPPRRIISVYKEKAPVNTPKNEFKSPYSHISTPCFRACNRREKQPCPATVMPCHHVWHRFSGTFFLTRRKGIGISIRYAAERGGACQEKRMVFFRGKLDPADPETGRAGAHSISVPVLPGIL